MTFFEAIITALRVGLAFLSVAAWIAAWIILLVFNADYVPKKSNWLYRFILRFISVLIAILLIACLIFSVNNCEKWNVVYKHKTSAPAQIHLENP